VEKKAERANVELSAVESDCNGLFASSAKCMSTVKQWCMQMFLFHSEATASGMTVYIFLHVCACKCRTARWQNSAASSFYQMWFLEVIYDTLKGWYKDQQALIRC